MQRVVARTPGYASPVIGDGKYRVYEVDLAKAAGEPRSSSAPPSNVAVKAPQEEHASRARPGADLRGKRPPVGAAQIIKRSVVDDEIEDPGDRGSAEQIGLDPLHVHGRHGAPRRATAVQDVVHPP